MKFSYIAIVCCLLGVFAAFGCKANQVCSDFTVYDETIVSDTDTEHLTMVIEALTDWEDSQGLQIQATIKNTGTDTVRVRVHDGYRDGFPLEFIMINPNGETVVFCRMALDTPVMPMKLEYIPPLAPNCSLTYRYSLSEYGMYDYRVRQPLGYNCATELPPSPGYLEQKGVFQVKATYQVAGGTVFLVSSFSMPKNNFIHNYDPPNIIIADTIATTFTNDAVPVYTTVEYEVATANLSTSLSIVHE